MKHPISWYKPGRVITVNDKMQKGYSYTLEAPYGKITDPLFSPDLTPSQMLSYGIFEGKYMTDCRDEFPTEWYEKAQLCTNGIADISCNYFKIKSRQSLQIWRQNGWIYGPDVRGWFQWYCRYYIGRRIPEIDKIQIKRWRAFIRHVSQVKKNCSAHDLQCRPKQRQALLQWAYDPFI